MKAFRFSLQQVLEVYETRESAAEQDLALCRSRLEEARHVRRQIVHAIDLQIREFESGSARGRHTDLMAIFTYLDKLQGDLARQAQAIARIEADAEAKREVLCQRVRERKSTEKLKEKEHRQWLADANHAEQKLIDETAVIGFATRAS